MGPTMRSPYRRSPGRAFMTGATRGSIPLTERYSHCRRRATFICQPGWRQTITPKPAWLDGRVDALLTTLHELGMSVSRDAAAELIHERLQWVFSQLGISRTAARRYLTDDALADLARAMVISLADETPGADVI